MLSERGEVDTDWKVGGVSALLLNVNADFLFFFPCMYSSLMRARKRTSKSVSPMHRERERNKQMSCQFLVWRCLAGK